MPGWSARRFVDSGEKPESIRTCEAKSLYYAGFKSLVKSLENTSLRRFLKGSRPIADSGEHLTLWSRRTVGQLGEDMAEAASRPRYGGSVVGSDGGTSSAYRPRLGEAKTKGGVGMKVAAFLRPGNPAGGGEECVYASS